MRGFRGHCTWCGATSGDMTWRTTKTENSRICQMTQLSVCWERACSSREVEGCGGEEYRDYADLIVWDNVEGSSVAAIGGQKQAGVLKGVHGGVLYPLRVVHRRSQTKSSS